MSTHERVQNWLPSGAMACLIRVADRIELSSGEEFIREGEFDESIFFIEVGEVEVIRGGARVGTVEAGDVVGEVAFIDRRPRTASVKALVPTVLQRVERADLLRELGQDPTLLLEFVQALDSRRKAHLGSGTAGEVNQFMEALTQEAIRHRAVNHPYLFALRDGKFPDMPWALADFARQYNGYSAHFPRYLTTVISKLELPEHRAALMENLTEEAGIYEAEELEELAEIGVAKEWVAGIPHPLLFRRFCVAAGVERVKLESDAIEVICWREMFLSVLSSGTPAEALGALGLGTENVVSTIYQHFLPALEVLQAPASDTVFFPLHAAVDDHHQETLLDISKYYAQTDAGRVDLIKGMRKALALRAGFWDWLHMRALSQGKCDQGVTMTFPA